LTTQCKPDVNTMDKSTGALVLQNYEAFLITVLRRLRPCLQPAQERETIVARMILDRSNNIPRLLAAPY